MKNRPAPLPHEWMLVSIIGFFVSWLFLYGDLGMGEGHSWAVKWGAAFMVFFIIVFIASMVNLSADRLDEEHLERLAIRKR